ncbi:E3 ubiquitin-protein ligase ATL4-like [Teratosphaeria destructans]|uniref:E3 ubiquitin-protein ligase ATL4-like n=1 Tax=Teratosphaeria destructans TaxID=418781 RepID=A0A9W7SXL7_9PEZI|nr:E3 ubiquitin-protein ligase ATL4-like [Teratosphaeria destructans]
MEFTLPSALPTKEFYTTGHVSSHDVADLPADRRDCQICMMRFEKISTNDLEKNPLLAEETVVTCGPVGSGCRRHHMFHSKCIGTWLEMNNTCPTCRTTVYSKEERDEDVPLFDDNSSDDEAVVQSDDYADYLTHIANVAPTSPPTEQLEPPQEPWFEVHAQYLEHMVSGRIEAWRAADDASFDEELYSDAAAMPPRPALTGYQGKGTLHATKLTDHLACFFWNTFTVNLPTYMTTGKFGAVCHPAAMSMWERLDRAIRRSAQGGRTTVAQLQETLDQVWEEEAQDVPVAVRSFVDAMIEEVLLAFESSAMAQAEEREERRWAKMTKALMGSKMRVSPTWLAHREHMDMLRRRR